MAGKTMPSKLTGKKNSQAAAPDTMSDALRPYAFGEKLRTLRLKKSMGLVQLGNHTGLSPAMLSKLETGKLIPTVPTLMRIAMVFNVGLDHFFADDRKRHPLGIVRKKERIRLPEAPEDRVVAYEFESLDFKVTERKLNSYLAHFHQVPEDKLRSHSHAGVEFIYLMSGSLQLQVGTETHRLDAGDSIYFDSSVRHSYQRVSKGECSAVLVTA
jgi:transcriptional regulator with XRE-family HTH domain